MNPGSQACAAAIDDTPASRSSLTIRSCNVPNARSMRPFACGLLAQMMSMFSANSARPNWVTPPAFAGAGSAAGSLLAVHPEDAVLVAVERHRLAMLLQIGADCPEVIKRRFRSDEPQLHQPARRIIHETQQRARRAAILEPGVLRAVDLHQFAQAIAPPARLMRRGETMPTVLPQPICNHPTAQRLARHRATVMLCQLLCCQRRAKVGIPLPHDRQRQD